MTTIKKEKNAVCALNLRRVSLRLNTARSSGKVWCNPEFILIDKQNDIYLFSVSTD